MPREDVTQQCEQRRATAVARGGDGTCTGQPPFAGALGPRRWPHPGEGGERGHETAVVFRATGLSRTKWIITKYDKTELAGEILEQNLTCAFLGQT